MKEIVGFHSNIAKHLYRGGDVTATIASSLVQWCKDNKHGGGISQVQTFCKIQKAPL